MKLRALQCLCELSRCGFNMSRAAEHLHATQPAVTRQIQLLEAELGFEVLVRRRNRIVGLSTEGEALIGRAEQILDFRILRDARTIVAVGILEGLGDDREGRAKALLSLFVVFSLTTSSGAYV